MRWHLLFIYSLSFVMLCTFSSSKSRSKPLPNNTLIDHISTNLERSFEKKENSSLLVAFVSGNKKKLPKRIKQNYLSLCLFHLFTPSGIHLSAIYLLLRPFFSLIRKRRVKLSLSIQIILCLSLFLLPGCYSLKRISAIRIFCLFLPKKIPIIWPFYSVFLADFLIGSFKLSHLSHIYSLLFLGTIISTPDRRLLPFTLTAAQSLIVYFSGGTISILAPIFGFILTAIFTPFFISFFGTFLMATFYPPPFTEYFVAIFNCLVSHIAELNSSLPHFYPSISLLLILPILVIPLKYRIKTFLIALMVMIHTAPIINLPHSKPVPAKYHSPWFWLDKSNIVATKRTIKGYRIEYASGYRCHYHHFNWFYKESCY